MTNDIHFFETLDTSYTSNPHVADSPACKVYGIGKGIINCLRRLGEINTLNLNKVLYVSNFDCNLISIGSLDKLWDRLKIKNSHMIKQDNSEKAIGELLNRIIVNGFKSDDCPIKQICKSCITDKISRRPFSQKSKTCTSKPLDLSHIDLCGPMSTQTPGGRRYIMTPIDDYSRYRYIFLLRQKFQVTKVIKNFIQFCHTQFNRKPKVFRSDLGGEYVNSELKDYLQHHGIHFQHTTPYTPEQNGIAEHKNRYIVEAIRAMFIDARLPNKYKGDAAAIVVYIQNRIPIKEKFVTPYELLYNTKPNLQHLKEFESRALVL